MHLNPTKNAAKIIILKRYNDLRNISTSTTRPYSGIEKMTWSNTLVCLDKKLSWNIHINKKLTQNYAKMRILYLLVNLKSTLQVKSSLILFTSIIRPLISYACPIWATHLSTKINNMQSHQNKFLRICFKALYGSWEIVKSIIIHNYLSWIHGSKPSLKTFTSNL